MSEQIILERLEQLEKLISNQSLLQKPVLSFQEACQYLEVSASHLYKLTSASQIPHFCPQGKKLYFKRLELEEWLLRNRKASVEELGKKADTYLLNNKKA